MDNDGRQLYLLDTYCGFFYIDIMGKANGVSPRLSVIAEEIAQSGFQDILYDIGADHAYLSIFLVKAGICGTVVATDISPRSIERARLNAEAQNIPVFDYSDHAHCRSSGSSAYEARRDIYCPGGIQLYEGDGFSSIPDYIPGKTVVIAGIGGESIIRIIENGIARARSASLLIFQPMSRQEKLRDWLLNNSFCVRYERLAPEGGRIYSILFCQSVCIPQQYAPEDIYVGCHVKYTSNVEYIQFLRFTRRKIINRYNGLKAENKNHSSFSANVSTRSDGCDGSGCNGNGVGGSEGSGGSSGGGDAVGIPPCRAERDAREATDFEIERLEAALNRIDSQLHALRS